MAKKTTVKPSDFWLRLERAYRPLALPVLQPFSPTTLAKHLGRRQGGVYRWFTGEGLPEIPVLEHMADETGSSLDLLLRGRVFPSTNPIVNEIATIAEELAEDGQSALLRSARLELLQQQQHAVPMIAPKPAGKKRA